MVEMLNTLDVSYVDTHYIFNQLHNYIFQETRVLLVGIEKG